MIWLVDDGPLRARAESVASIEPVAGGRFPNARFGRDVRRDVPRLAIPNLLSLSFSEVYPPGFSFFLKMLENTFLKLPEYAGKRGLSLFSKPSDRRGDVRGEVIDVNVRGRLEKRDERVLEVERLDRGD